MCPLFMIATGSCSSLSCSLSCSTVLLQSHVARIASDAVSVAIVSYGSRNTWSTNIHIRPSLTTNSWHPNPFFGRLSSHPRYQRLNRTPSLTSYLRRNTRTVLPRSVPWKNDGMLKRLFGCFGIGKSEREASQPAPISRRRRERARSTDAAYSTSDNAAGSPRVKQPGSPKAKSSAGSPRVSAPPPYQRQTPRSPRQPATPPVGPPPATPYRSRKRAWKDRRRSADRGVPRESNRQRPKTAATGGDTRAQAGNGQQPVAPAVIETEDQSLWGRAMGGLTPKQQRLLTSVSIATNNRQIATDVRTVIAEIVKSRNEKEWNISFMGKTIHMKEIGMRILQWADRFKNIGTIIAQYDPVHAALPWAGFRFLLQVKKTPSIP